MGFPHVKIQLGWVYWQMGDKQEADKYFNEVIEFYNRLHELDRGGRVPQQAYYNLASVYAFRGEKDKAYENLRIMIQSRQGMVLKRVVRIKTEPYFDSMRNEPEFQQIVSEVEAKYQTEHERVREWLEENDML